MTWVKHYVERDGVDKVKTWYWEPWKKANLPYWQGTPEEFYKLHDDAIAAVRRALRLSGLPMSATGAQRLHHRIDEDHSNVFALWKLMGSPQDPRAEQSKELDGRGMLETIGDAQQVVCKDVKAQVEFALPRTAVSFLVFKIQQ